MTMRPAPTRMQIGASRLENLPEAQLKVFLDLTWVHLGDAPGSPSWPRRLLRTLLTRKRPDAIEALYAKTHFEVFRYAKGDRFPWESGSMSFIYSEHFFEHLFLDEAISLLAECRRVLMDGGTLRIVVPDADLRTYEVPEPVGYPSRRLPFTHPDKHKTRWSVYSLSEALRLAGFAPSPLRYCDREGQYVQLEPIPGVGCLEPHLIQDLSYVRRPHSLIVDGHTAPTHPSLQPVQA